MVLWAAHFISELAKYFRRSLAILLHHCIDLVFQKLLPSSLNVHLPTGLTHKAELCDAKLNDVFKANTEMMTSSGVVKILLFKTCFALFVAFEQHS